MAKFISIPSKLLLETQLRPTSKIIYALLVKDSDMNGVSQPTIRTLQKGLTTSIGSESQVLEEAVIRAHLKSLEEVGYIKIKSDNPKFEIQIYDEPKEAKPKAAVQGTLFGTEAKKKDGLAARRKKHSADILELMHYISTSRICRGYSDTKLVGVTHENAILKALEAGHTLSDLKAFTNLMFDTEWYKNKPELLVPTTMFKQATLERLMPTLTKDSTYRNSKIVEFGLDFEPEVVYNDKSKGDVMF